MPGNAQVIDAQEQVSSPHPRRRAFIANVRFDI
ncbi:hypothetical protein ABIC38_006383 [Variovorax sp. 1126]|jgi:hypothetical protein